MSEQGDLSDALGAPAGPELPLTGQQHALLVALDQKDPDVGMMYRGALHVLQSSNPDRFALAAHAIRELMEKLPKYLDVPARGAASKSGPSLTVKVRELKAQWTWLSDEEIAVGEISIRLRNLLGDTRAFFAWFEENYRTRRSETAAALRALDGTRRYLPAPIEELKVKHWAICNEFFQAVSHHGKRCTEMDFLGYLGDLELFLLDHLRPRTFEDFASLDAIIDEGEKDA